MCKVLNVTRSLIYYHIKQRKDVQKKSLSEGEVDLENKVIKIFKDSKNNYGTRKIKRELVKENMIASRKKIGDIMNKYGLVSNYTVKQFKPSKSKVNEDKIENIVDRDFDRGSLEVIVSDLTYIRVGDKWNYLCTIMDLFNREVIGYSVGPKKDANLVYEAFMRCKYPLNNIKVFHTDRGSEFRNKQIGEVLDLFGIERSLSKKGCPYDNAVIESMYNIVKKEFVKGKKFNNIGELESGLFEYFNWYNTKRIHGSLGYVTPIEYRSLNKLDN